MAGLDERLRIRNNDELADALAVRLETVKSPETEWLPEILSLFLHLSNDPANETRIEDLDRLDRGALSPALTWQEIIRDDPLDNTDGIWDVPSYDEESSDDSEASTPRALPQKTRSRTKIVKEDEQAFLDEALDYEPLESSTLQWLANVQFWKKAPEKSERITITEVQVIREVIFMLMGLPTSLFRQNTIGAVEPIPAYALLDVSFEALEKILSIFADIGTKLDTIRKATKASNQVPFVQTFQFNLGSRLKVVETTLSDIEHSIISPIAYQSISLIEILQQVQSMAEPLLQACDIATNVFDTGRTPFAVLEALFDWIIKTQSVDDSLSYGLACDLFLASLATYLQSVSRWMISGILDSNDDTLFIAKVEKEIPPSQLWSDQYEAKYFQDGTLQAPHFLHAAAKRIFNTGKSVVMLGQLGNHSRGPDTSPLSFADLLRKNIAAGSLCPFEEVFTASLDTWIVSHFHSDTSNLRAVIEISCGLWRHIDALEHVYFFRNGHVSSRIASLIFARLNARKGRVWYDHFVLTAIHREAFASVSSIDAQRLAISPVPSVGNSNQSSRSVKELAKVSVVYTLPWSVSNIIKPYSIIVMQSIYTLLLQITRSRYLLRHVYQLYSTTRPRASHDKPLELLGLSVHHRFLWFLDTLYEHLTGTVLLQASVTLRERMEAAEDLDQMIEVYDSFARLVEQECFVHASRAGIKKAILSILDLVVLFEGVTIANEATPMHPRRRLRRKSDASSESNGNDSDADAPGHKTPHRRNAAADMAQLTNISGTYNKLLHFIIASLGQIQSELNANDHHSQALLDNLSLGIKRG